MNKSLIRRGTFDDPADFVTWEVEYDDGTIDRESECSYAGIDRNKFKSFRFISPDGTILMEIQLPANVTGHNFVYRRRNAIDGQNRTVIIVAGFMPMGPAIAINVAQRSYRVSDNGFVEHDPDLYPPQPMPGELMLETLC